MLAVTTSPGWIRNPEDVKLERAVLSAAFLRQHPRSPWSRSTCAQLLLWHCRSSMQSSLVLAVALLVTAPPGLLQGSAVPLACLHRHQGALCISHLKVLHSR